MNRQIPTGKNFMTKDINDLLYGYFQITSFFGEDKDGNQVRFVYKNNFTNERLSEIIRLSLSQTKRKVKVLKDSGFIKETKVWNPEHTELFGAYVLTEYAEKIQYISIRTLEKLVYSTNKNVIKVYAYLLGWYSYKQLQSENYIFTKKELIQQCFGLSATTNQRDYDAINTILECLSLFGLIEYRGKRFRAPDGQIYYKIELLKVHKNIKSVN